MQPCNVTFGNKYEEQASEDVIWRQRQIYEKGLVLRSVIADPCVRTHGTVCGSPMDLADESVVTAAEALDTHDLSDRDDFKTCRAGRGTGQVLPAE